MASTQTSSQSTADAMLAEQRRQRRRDRMLMMTLIEMLSIMVFVAMAYALASRNEAELNTDWKAMHQSAMEKLADTERQLAALTKELELARNAARALAEEYTGQALPIDPDKSWEEIQRILKEIAEKKRSGQEDQRKRAQTALAGGGAFGLPTCTLPALAYTVTLYADDTMQATSAWATTEYKAVSGMTAVTALASAGRLPRGAFSDLARKANIDAGRSGACLLRIVARPAETYFHDVYMRQVNELARWFSVRRVGMDGR